MRSSSISLDRHGSKIRKVSRCGPAVSNGTIPATGQEFFFAKVAPVQSITDIVLLDFWLMLLPWIIFSSYTIIYFFVKNFFSSEVHMSVNTTFEMFFCWERSHRLSTYATSGGWGIIQNAYSCVQGEGRVRLHVYVRTCTISFHVLGSSFCLILFCFVFYFFAEI